MLVKIGDIKMIPIIRMTIGDKIALLFTQMTMIMLPIVKDAWWRQEVMS